MPPAPRRPVTSYCPIRLPEVSGTLEILTVSRGLVTFARSARGNGVEKGTDTGIRVRALDLVSYFRLCSRLSIAHTSFTGSGRLTYARRDPSGLTLMLVSVPVDMLPVAAIPVN